MTKRAFVLLSGGIDSTTCLYKAIWDFAPKGVDVETGMASCAAGLRPTWDCDWVEAVSVDYGQRHSNETLYAARHCDKFGIKHTVLQLPDALAGTGVMLTDADEAIPNMSYDEIKGVSPTYVPFRNGTLLSLITAHAQKWVNKQIEQAVSVKIGGNKMRDLHVLEATEDMRDSVGVYFGAHAEDAAGWAYPDCTPEFIGAMANAIYVGTYNCCRLHTPLQWLNKSEIIRLGETLGVDWSLTWSCYAGGERHCGVCPTCRARHAGFVKAGVADPTEYAAAA